MGPIDQLLSMVPGLGSKMKGMDFDESQLKRVEAIIQSMTREERANPQMIGSSRRKRIAAGSGTTTQDVNRLLQQFKDMQKMMKMFGKLSPKQARRAFPFQM
jgi:signal recognition particle subunit SRP54